MDRHFHGLAVAIAGAGLSFMAFSISFAPPRSNQKVPTSIEVVGQSHEALKIVNNDVRK